MWIGTGWLGDEMEFTTENTEKSGEKQRVILTKVNCLDVSYLMGEVIRKWWIFKYSDLGLIEHVQPYEEFVNLNYIVRSRITKEGRVAVSLVNGDKLIMTQPEWERIRNLLKAQEEK